MKKFSIIIAMITAFGISGCGLGNFGKKAEDVDKNTTEEVRKETVERPAEEPSITSVGIFVDDVGIKDWFESYSASMTSKNRFSICSGYGCQVRTVWKPDREDLATISSLFRSVRDAASERDAIKAAIAKYEALTGEVIGTTSDKPGAQFMNNGNKTQFDFIDETINVTNYLVNMYENGMLKYHSVKAPEWQSMWCINCDAAPVIEDKDGNSWVIESDGVATGSPSIIKDKKEWLAKD